MTTAPISVSDPKTSAAAGLESEASQITALLEGAGLASLDSTGWLRVTGEDRVRWLNGMTTNSIQQLAPGEGNYNFLLSAQGRIQGDAYAFAEPDSILLETDRSRLPVMMELLDRFIIMDDVELTDISSTRHGLLCAGPRASTILAAVGVEASPLEPLHSASTTWRGAAMDILHAYSPLVPRFEIWSESSETIAGLREALESAGAIACAPESLDHLRMLEGTPCYGNDIRDRELPQETVQTGGQSRALHFAKGCYLGQEIVERIRSRGNVHRVFQAFQLTGELPAAGSILEVEGKPVGELTSVAAIPLASGSIHFALGYIRREALENSQSRGGIIAFSGGVASPVATPFRIT